jgi:hypothetical protein
MKKKVIVYLSGGIGNQIFQYVAGIYLANKCDGQLILESRFGFMIDQKYQRKYLLNKVFELSCKQSSWCDTLILIGYLIKRKILRILNFSTNSFFGNFFFIEHDHNFETDFIFDDNFYKYWVVGYWQKQIEFVKPTRLLFNYLKMIAPSDVLILNLGRELRSVESVALGIRLYEEVENSELFMGSTVDIQIAKLNLAIKHLQKEHPNVRFYVFCTHNSRLIESVVLPNNSIFLTGDNGFKDPISSLWLISQCRHHIFTASSFYWWGAWLSMSIYQATDMKQKIYMINNNYFLSATQLEWESI